MAFTFANINTVYMYYGCIVYKRNDALRSKLCLYHKRPYDYAALLKIFLPKQITYAHFPLRSA